MTWLLAIPLMYSGFFLHSACVAPCEGEGILTVCINAAGKTMAAVGALVVLA